MWKPTVQAQLVGRVDRYGGTGCVYDTLFRPVLRSCLAASAATCWVYASPSLAQPVYSSPQTSSTPPVSQAPPAPQPKGQTTSSPQPEPAASGTALAEIVVTAQHRSENIQRVPIAITTATAQKLQSEAITNTVQLNAISPGLNIRTVDGSFSPYVRGIGTSSNIAENPVALYIDGVYIPEQREGIRELNDVSQIAVLKGPQGTLFGRNATGGVIQITTDAPSHTFGGKVETELDNYLTTITDGYVTGPITDTLAFNLSGQYGKQFDGFGKNFTTGNDTYQLIDEVDLRGKLLFTPAHGTRITLSADYLYNDSNTNSFQPLLGTHFSLPGFGLVNNRYDTYAGVDPFTRFEGGGVSLNAEQELGFAHLVVISAYRRGVGENLLSPTADAANSFLVNYYSAPNESFSQEVQLVASTGRFTWLLGTFYFHNRDAVLPVGVDFSGLLAPTPASPTAINDYGTEVTESVAPFGQFSWEFISGTTLTGGARWTYERRSADLSQDVTLKSGFLINPPAVNPSVTFEKPSYRVALSQQLGPQLLGYASYNTGFKSGGFNITNPSNPSYLPEELKSTEVGLKSEILDRRLRLNLAAYYYDYENLQVTLFSNGMQTIANGASAELYGLDADFEAQLPYGLRLSGGLALEHTEFTSYPNAVIGTPQANGSVVLAEGSAKGNRLPLAQEVSSTLDVGYHRELARGAFDADVTTNYNGDYYFEADNGGLRQGPYVMLNTSLKYTLPSGRLSFRLFGRNLLDKAILEFPTTQTFGYDANYAPPRTFGIAAQLTF